MAYNINTKTVVAEIDERVGGSVHITVTCPEIHEGKWVIKLYNKGVYANYTGKSASDEYCIISESDSGVSMLWDGYNHDLESFIIARYDDINDWIDFNSL